MALLPRQLKETTVGFLNFAFLWLFGSSKAVMLYLYINIASGLWLKPHVYVQDETFKLRNSNLNKCFKVCRNSPKAPWGFNRKFKGYNYSFTSQASDTHFPRPIHGRQQSLADDNRNAHRSFKGSVYLVLRIASIITLTINGFYLWLISYVL